MQFCLCDYVRCYVFVALVSSPLSGDFLSDILGVVLKRQLVDTVSPETD